MNDGREFPDDDDARALSPCIDRCTLDQRGVCVGCRRTIDEILAWARMGPRARREVLAALPGRAAGGGG